MPRFLFALPLLLIFASPTARAQQPSLPGCEAPPPIRRVIKDQLHSPEFDRLTYAAQIERKQQVLSKLMERYPREVEPYNLWIATVREDQLLHPELLAGLQRTYREQAAAHPNDPLALYLAAASLRSTGTPESIRLLDQAQSLSPSFAWPALELAQIYSSGKFADKAKFTYQLTKFWTACPTSQDQQARWMLVKVPDLQKQVAKAERASLAKTTDPAAAHGLRISLGPGVSHYVAQRFSAIARASRRRCASVWRASRIRIPTPIGQPSCFMEAKQAGASARRNPSAGRRNHREVSRTPVMRRASSGSDGKMPIPSPRRGKTLPLGRATTPRSRRSNSPGSSSILIRLYPPENWLFLCDAARR